MPNLEIVWKVAHAETSEYYQEVTLALQLALRTKEMLFLLSNLATNWKPLGA